MPRRKLRSPVPRPTPLTIHPTTISTAAVTAPSTRRSMTRAPRTRENPSQSLKPHRSRLPLHLVSASFFCDTMGRSATQIDRLSCSRTFSLPCLARCSLCHRSCAGSRVGCVCERFSRLGRFLDRGLCVRQRAREGRPGAANSVVQPAQDSPGRGGGRLLVWPKAQPASEHHLSSFCRRSLGVRHSMALDRRVRRDCPDRLLREHAATGARLCAVALQAAQDDGDAQFGRTARVSGLRQGVHRLPQILRADDCRRGRQGALSCLRRALHERLKQEAQTRKGQSFQTMFCFAKLCFALQAFVLLRKALG